ncbi:MAG: SprB repeat-containing protein [Lentimicrobiaceae bacterium]|nr:SprB repeat-containing protein [Lentimicrobiaceae bacterium]
MKRNRLVTFSKVLLSLGMLFTTQSIHSQYIISYPAAAEGMTICRDTALLHVRIEVTLNTAFDTVTITLPPGISYVPGSIVTLDSNRIGLSMKEAGGTLGVPRFAFNTTNLQTNDFVEFTIERQADCDAYVHANTGGVFKDIVRVSGSSGSVVDSNVTVNAYNVGYPIISFIQPLALNDVVIGGSYQRSFSVTNGAQGCADKLGLYIVYPGGGIELDSLRLNGKRLYAYDVIDDTLFFRIAGADTLTSDGVLCNGESIILTEYITIRACNTVTTYRAGWGCSAAPSGWCSTVPGTGSITMAVGTPALTALTQTTLNFVDACTPWSFVITAHNGGTGGPVAAAMFNAVIQFAFGDLPSSVGHIDTSRITIDSILIGSQKVAWSLVTNPIVTYWKIVNIDLNQITADPDGLGGLDDLDMDGRYDDLRGTDSVKFRIFVRWKCGLYCTGNFIRNFNTRILCNSMCGSPLTMAALRVSPPIEMGMTVDAITVYPPVNVIDNEPFEIRIQNSSVYSSTSLFHNSAQRFRYRVVIPADMVVDSVFFGATGMVPVVINDTLFVTSNDATLYPLRIFAHYVCPPGSSGYREELPVFLDYLQNGTTGCGCFNTIRCATYKLNIICSGGICLDGPANFLPVLRRTDGSLGFTDSTATTRVNPNTLTPIQLKRAWYGDSLQMVSTMVQTGNYNNLYLQFSALKTPAGYARNRLAPVNADVRFFRGGTMIDSCRMTSFAVIAHPDSAFTRFVLNITDSLPIDYQDLDSVHVVSRYAVIRDSTDMADVWEVNGVSHYFYNLDAGDETYCGGAYIPEFYLARLGVNMHPSSTQVTEFLGCASYPLSVADNYTLGQFGNTGIISFPGEFRPGHYIDSIKVVIPAGFVLDSAMRIGSGIATQYSVKKLIVPAYFDNNSAVFVNDGSWPLTKYSDNNSFWSTFRYYISPTCNGLYPMNQYIRGRMFAKSNYWNHAVPLGNIPPDTSITPPVIQNVDWLIQAGSNAKPGITLTNETGPIQAFQPTHKWKVRMSNVSSQTAPYTWLAIPEKPGITITSVVSVSGPPDTLLPTNYAGGRWYQISAAGLSSGTFADYDINFTYNSCQSDSLHVIAGWNCSEWPTEPGTYPCATTEVFCHFTPVEAGVEVISKAEPTLPAELCDTLSYQYNVNCTQAGNTTNNQFRIIFTPGLSLVPDSILAVYPANGTNWQPILYQFNGDTLIGDLTSHPDYPVLTGLPGVQSGADTNHRQIAVRFKLLTGCAFVAGTSFAVNTQADRACGEPANGVQVLTLSSPLTISGLEVDYRATHTLTINHDLYCTGSVHMAMTTEIRNDSTSGNGLIQVTLPLGVSYVTGSLGCSTSPYCPGFVGVAANAGREVVTLSLPVGVPENTVLRYSMEVHYSADGTCGPNTVDMRSLVVFDTVICPSAPGGYCIGSLTQTGIASATLILRKPAFVLDQFAVRGWPGGVGGEQVEISLRISNVGSDMLLGQDAWVVFFTDENESGAFEAGTDVYIGRVNFSDLRSGDDTSIMIGHLVPAGLNTCQYLAVISSTGLAYNTNCICQPSEVVAMASLHYEAAGPNRAVCPAVFEPMGWPAIPGYGYTWSPGTNLSDSTIANPFFSSPVQGIFTYVITVQRPGGCALASDTVTLTVFSPFNVATGIEDVSCFNAGDGSITITVTGGVPPYSYSIDNGLTYPYSGASPFTISNLPAGEYKVRVRDSNGCVSTPCN